MRRQRIVIALMLLVFSGYSYADLVTYTDSAMQTTSGQAFTFTVNSAEIAAGEGTFTITARGDYSVGYPGTEYLDWNIDSLVSGSGWAPANADSYTTYLNNDVLWTRTITIDAATMSNITSDGLFTILIDLCSVVDHFYSTDEVSYSLSYNVVPTPSALLLGFMGLGVAIRKIRSRA